MLIVCALGRVDHNSEEYRSTANVPEPGWARLADNSLVPVLSVIGNNSSSPFTRNEHASRTIADVVSNGGFETGLAPWTTTPVGGLGFGCGQPWTRASTGSTCIAVANPPGGSFALYSSFDGAGPLNFVASQVITIPIGLVNAVISFRYQAEWSFSGANRLFTIDANGTPLVTVLNLPSGSGNTGLLTFTQVITAQLAAYSGSTITLGLHLFVPQSFTGPAGIVVDNVSLILDFNGNE